MKQKSFLRPNYFRNIVLVSLACATAHFTDSRFEMTILPSETQVYLA